MGFSGKKVANFEVSVIAAGSQHSRCFTSVPFASYSS
jgi:hypothetical protein